MAKTTPEQEKLVIEQVPTGRAFATVDSNIHLKIEKKITFGELIIVLRDLAKANKISAIKEPGNQTRYYREPIDNFLKKPSIAVAANKPNDGYSSIDMTPAMKKTPTVKAKVVTEPIIQLQPETNYTLTINEQSFGPFKYVEKWHDFTKYKSNKSEIIVIEDTPSFLDQIWGFRADIEDRQVKIISASPDIAEAVNAAYKGTNNEIT